MYNFRDTIESSEGFVLPSEALQINGEYIENLIAGYRTLSVSGREALAPELTCYETGIRDGSKVQNRRFPGRTIIVRYQLIAKTNESFREAYNALGRVLNVQDAELIFNDEPDKFYIGTPSYIGEVEPGRNAVIGEIEFYCADPFKYSLVEYEAEPWAEELTNILIDYNGTYKAYPRLEASFYSEADVKEDGTSGTLTGNGDCGYVAFFNEKEKIVQLGEPDETDGENAYAKAQTLFNQLFQTSGAWGSAASALWSANAGVVAPNTVQQVGSVGMGVASYAAPANPKATSGTLLKNAEASLDAPTFYYTVTAKTSNRTANSVRVDVAITTSLKNPGSYFGRGLGLRGLLYIGGSWRTVTIKKTDEYWKGQSGHTVNLTVNVTGLSASQTALTGIKFKTERTDSNGVNSGRLNETACSNLAISPYAADEPETYFLKANSYGSASGKWHGPSITRVIPADAAGNTGAENFTLTYKQKMCIGDGKNDTNQLGAFQVQLLDASGANVAGVRIVKSAAGKNANVNFYVNGVVVHTNTIDLSYNNKYFGSKENAVHTSKITKSGNAITFSVGGKTLTFTSSTLAGKVARRVTFMFEQYSTSTALSYNGLYWAKFVKNNCDTWKNVPNKFSANDVVVADCKNGEIYLNGSPSPELGALGNDWEEFYLEPGLNQIGVGYSEWVTSNYAPSFKVRYREVFL